MLHLSEARKASSDKRNKLYHNKRTSRFFISFPYHVIFNALEWLLRKSQLWKGIFILINDHTMREITKNYFYQHAEAHKKGREPFEYFFEEAGIFS